MVLDAADGRDVHLWPSNLSRLQTARAHDTRHRPDQASSSILAHRRAWHASSPDFSASRRYRCAASPPDHRDVFARCQPGAAIFGKLVTNPGLSQGSHQVSTGRGSSTRLRPRGTDRPPSSRAGACQYRGHHRRTLSGRGRLHIHQGYEPDPPPLIQQSRWKIDGRAIDDCQTTRRLLRDCRAQALLPGT